MAKMSIQRLRNLTTGKLHTEMDDIYKDIEFITGAEGVMTHMLPNACQAMHPYLKKCFPDPHFWDGKFNPEHTGEVEIEPMPPEELEAFWDRFSNLPCSLAGHQ